MHSWKDRDQYTWAGACTQARARSPPTSRKRRSRRSKRLSASRQPRLRKPEEFCLGVRCEEHTELPSAPDVPHVRALDETEIMNDMPLSATLEGFVVVDVSIRGPADATGQLAEVLVELNAYCCQVLLDA